jgi:hypothetical protein
MDANPGEAWTPKELLGIAFRHPPQSAPDASYEYSNTNYTLLGLIAEKVGGGRHTCIRVIYAGLSLVAPPSTTPTPTR